MPKYERGVPRGAGSRPVLINTPRRDYISLSFFVVTGLNPRPLGRVEPTLFVCRNLEGWVGFYGYAVIRIIRNQQPAFGPVVRAGICN